MQNELETAVLVRSLYQIKDADGVARPFPIPSRVAYEIVMDLQGRSTRPLATTAGPCRTDDGHRYAEIFLQ